jgi:hypothetical protein
VRTSKARGIAGGGGFRARRRLKSVMQAATNEADMFEPLEPPEPQPPESDDDGDDDVIVDDGLG